MKKIVLCQFSLPVVLIGMQIKYVDQMEMGGDPGYEQWADRSCAIACMMMLLRSWTNYNGDMMQLVSEVLAIDGFHQGVGWKHGAMCQVLQNHGISAQIERDLTIDQLQNILMQGRAVILSVNSRITPGGGHMVLLIADEYGIKMLDPYNEDGLGGVKYISIEELLPVMRGKGISVTVSLYIRVRSWLGGISRFKPEDPTLYDQTAET